MRSSLRLLAPLSSFTRKATQRGRVGGSSANDAIKAAAAAAMKSFLPLDTAESSPTSSNNDNTGKTSQKDSSKRTNTKTNGTASSKQGKSSTRQEPMQPNVKNTKKRTTTARAANVSTSSSPLISLNKYMAHQGLCSRREAIRYLDKGWVLVNGVIPTKDQFFMDPSTIQSVELTNQAYTDQAQRATILLHKPLGIISSQPESPQQIPAIQLLTPDRQYHGIPTTSDHNGTPNGAINTPSRDSKPLNKQGLAVAGRLDANATGLLVMTQSGKIAKELIGPESTVEKEYLVRIPMVRDLAGKLRTLNEGVVEASTGICFQANSIEQINDDQLKFVFTAGISHQIHRMCQIVGLPIQAVKRVRIGKVVLGDLPLGKWKYLPANKKFS